MCPSLDTESRAENKRMSLTETFFPARSQVKSQGHEAKKYYNRYFVTVCGLIL